MTAEPGAPHQKFEALQAAEVDVGGMSILTRREHCGRELLISSFKRRGETRKLLSSRRGRRGVSMWAVANYYWGSADFRVPILLRFLDAGMSYEVKSRIH